MMDETKKQEAWAKRQEEIRAIADQAESKVVPVDMVDICTKEAQHNTEEINNTEAADNTETTDSAETQEAIKAAIDTLLEREKRVIVLRSGIEDGIERSREEVAEILGVSKERIRQIEARALRKLRAIRRMQREADRK